MEENTTLSGLGHPVLRSKNSLLILADIVTVPHYFDNLSTLQHSQPDGNILLRQRLGLVILKGPVMEEQYLVGRLIYLTFGRDEQGHIIDKKHSQAGIDKWLYEVAYPSPKFTEETILVVVPNQIEWIIKNPEYSEDFKLQYQQAVLKWRDAAIEELHIRGLSTTKL